MQPKRKRDRSGEDHQIPIKDNKTGHDKIQASLRLLEITNRHTKMTPLLNEVLSEFQKMSGCQAMGIRIFNQEDHISYQAYIGFNKQLNDQKRLPIDDCDFCECVRVANGLTDPTLPYYTKGGSFHTNGTSQLLSGLNKAEKVSTGMACNHLGYESVALIPIQLDSRILGLIHIMESQSNTISLETVTFFEALARRLALPVQRIQSEIKSKENQALLEKVIDNLPEGMVYRLIHRPDGSRSFTHSTKGCRRLFQVGRKEIANDANILYDMIPSEFKENEVVAEDESMEDLEIFDFEMPMRIPDGRTRWIRWHSKPRRWDDGTLIWDGVCLDVSRARRAEEDLRKAKEKAEAANNAKSVFLASMSHELRTPLNAILGFANMLAREETTSADQKKKLALINNSGRHLLSMINDVLDLSKIEANRIELRESFFNLVDLVEEISAIIKLRATEKGLSLALETTLVNYPHVKADIGKLRQILINLLSNAVKFTYQGKVIIRCTVDAIPEMPKHCLIVIEVKDTGPGISPSMQKKIFEPFVQENDVPGQKGTGLGLSISKQYIEFMGGSIKLESEPGKGSLFRVNLPAGIAGLSEVKVPVVEQSKVIGLAAPFKKWQILVADDNKENLFLLKSLLEKIGMVVLEAENGKEAVSLFKNKSPDFIWMDMRMPVMDGYEAVRQIRMQPGGCKVPVIAITASAFNEQRGDILAAGCNDMVSKPFQIHEIYEMMGRFLDITYIYEPKDPVKTFEKHKIELTPEMLADLPGKLLTDLQTAILALNREKAFEIIRRIADQAPEEAACLKDFVENYQMTKLKKLLGEIDAKAGKI